MVKAGTLYTYDGQTLGKRVRLVAAWAGLDIDVVPNFKLKEDNKTPEFLAKFPLGKVPAFEGTDGFRISEASAISKYLASLAPNSGLLGSTPKEAALVDQWITFADTELSNYTRYVSSTLLNYIPYAKPTDVHMRNEVFEALDVLNKYLHTRTFLVGHRVTVADLVLAQVLNGPQSAPAGIIGDAERKKYPNVVRYFETIAKNPKSVPILGEIKYLSTATQYSAPKKEKPAKEAGVVAAAGAAVAGAAAAVKEKVAPAKKSKKDDDDDDDEPLVPEEPKAKNPLDSLPKSTLNLEDWKRAYSNLDTRGPGGSLEWFYKNYDPEGYSLWKVAFKYPEELTQTFMSANQIGGFFNRLEASRKYLFGSVGVLGTSNNSLIEGALIARGQDIKPVIDVAPDWESYAYEKIDLSNEAQKAYFEAALAWDLEVDGKKWTDGKNFK